MRTIFALRSSVRGVVMRFRTSSTRSSVWTRSEPDLNDLPESSTPSGRSVPLSTGRGVDFRRPLRSDQPALMDGWSAVADSQGLLRAQDAGRLGLTSRDLAHLVASQDLVHLARGWYSLPFPVLGPPTETLWERRRQLHAAATRAMVRAYDGRAVASHHSALVLNGLPTFAADLRQVHLTRTTGSQSRRRAGLTIHRAIDGATWSDGVIDVSLAVLGTAITNGEMAGLIAADAALHRRLASPESLADVTALVAGPGSARVRRVVGHADGRAESPGETRLREALRLMGYRPVPQFAIVDGSFTALVDLYLEEHRLAIEFDGFVKYGRLDALSTQPTPADVLMAEKVREDHVRELGHGLARVTWPDLDLPHQLRQRIEALIRRIRTRRIA